MDQKFVVYELVRNSDILVSWLHGYLVTRHAAFVNI